MIAKAVNTFLKEERAPKVIAPVMAVRVTPSLPDNPTFADYTRKLKIDDVENQVNVMIKKAEDANAIKSKALESSSSEKENTYLPVRYEEVYSGQIRGIRNMIASLAKYARSYHRVHGYLHTYWDENESASHNREQILSIVDRISPPEKEGIAEPKKFDAIRETRFAIFKEDDAARIIAKELETDIEFQLRKALRAAKKSLISAPVKLGIVSDPSKENVRSLQNIKSSRAA